MSVFYCAGGLHVGFQGKKALQTDLYLKKRCLMLRQAVQNKKTVQKKNGSGGCAPDWALILCAEKAICFTLSSRLYFSACTCDWFCDDAVFRKKNRCNCIINNI